MRPRRASEALVQQPCSNPTTWSLWRVASDAQIEVMAKRKRKKNEEANASSKKKGELVERIVAMMHEGEPQIVVRRDVRLPAKHSGGRSRQIDVLLEGRFAGYSTMLAIECKNYGRPVDVGDVGQFRDLLEDVGLYANQGVLVSASGVSSGR